MNMVLFCITVRTLRVKKTCTSESGDDGREYPGDSRLEHASARLQKPFSPSELVRAIRVALDTEPDTSPSHVATAVAD